MVTYKFVIVLHYLYSLFIYGLHIKNYFSEISFKSFDIRVALFLLMCLIILMCPLRASIWGPGTKNNVLIISILAPVKALKSVRIALIILSRADLKDRKVFLFIYGKR